MTEQTSLPTRILYTTVRVGDLDHSIAFYRDAFAKNDNHVM